MLEEQQRGKRAQDEVGAGLIEGGDAGGVDGQARGQGRHEELCWGSGKPMEDPSRRAL